MGFNNILVVCVGNICRSPMAAALIKEQYPKKNIDSAGISAVVGHSADIKAIEIMAVCNIDMTDHIAKQISEQLVGEADLILTMSINQSKWIEDRWPHCRGKTFRIGHWIDKDIADPYGRSESAFEAAKQDIIESLDQWFNKI